MQTTSARQPKSGLVNRPESPQRLTSEHPTQESQELRERRELLVRQLMAEGCDADEAEDVLRLTLNP